MNKPYINLIISLTCLIIFFTMWVGFYFGKESQKDIYRDKANQVLSEAKQLSLDAEKDMQMSRTYLKLANKYMDSITVKETVYSTIRDTIYIKR